MNDSTNNSVGSPNSRGRVFGQKGRAERQSLLRKNTASATREKPGRDRKTPSRLFIGGSIGIAILGAVIVWSISTGGRNTDRTGPGTNTVAGSQKKHVPTASSKLPQCNSRGVNQAVEKRLKADMRKRKWRTDEFAANFNNLTEIDATANSRKCTMELETRAGTMPMVLAVTWTNKSKGLFQVKLQYDETQMRQVLMPKGTAEPKAPRKRR